jgi:hypothetical protein
MRIVICMQMMLLQERIAAFALAVLAEKPVTGEDIGGSSGII